MPLLLLPPSIIYIVFSGLSVQLRLSFMVCLLAFAFFRISIFFFVEMPHCSSRCQSENFSCHNWGILRVKCLLERRAERRVSFNLYMSGLLSCDCRRWPKTGLWRPDCIIITKRPSCPIPVPKCFLTSSLSVRLLCTTKMGKAKNLNICFHDFWFVILPSESNSSHPRTFRFRSLFGSCCNNLVHEPSNL